MKVSLKEYAYIHGLKHGTVRSYVAHGKLTVLGRDHRYTYVDSEELPQIRYSPAKHGKQPRLSNILRSMRARCYNPNNTHYSLYGGKGIQICDEWRYSLGAFVEWALKNGYDDSLTIDRIDPSGNYCPKNCRWISRSENSRKAVRDHAKERENAKVERVAYLDALRVY